MSVNADQVRHVARLARLALGDDEIDRMVPELNNILGWVEQLGEVNTDGVEPMAHPLPVQNVFREDEPVPSLPVDEALQNAPNRLADFFGVPAVFDTDEPVSH